MREPRSCGVRGQRARRATPQPHHGHQRHVAAGGPRARPAGAVVAVGLCKSQGFQAYGSGPVEQIWLRPPC